MKKMYLKRILSLAIIMAILACSFVQTAFAADKTYKVTFSTGTTATVTAGQDFVFAIVCAPPTDIKAIKASNGTLTAGKTTLGGPSTPQGIINGIWTLSKITADVTITLTLTTQEGADAPTITTGKTAAEAAISKAASAMGGPPPAGGAPGGAPPTGAPGGAPPAGGTPPTGAPVKAGITATATASSVLVDGKTVAFEAYTIGGNNYFKLRDLAKCLSGTSKQFDVGYDAAKNAITLTSGKAYTPLANETAAAVNKSNKTASLATAKVYLDGKEISLTAYNIGGNNYFKLRDIATALNFSVGYDNATKTITIETTKPYTAAETPAAATTPPAGAPPTGAPPAGAPPAGGPGGPPPA